MIETKKKIPHCRIAVGLKIEKLYYDS